MKRFVRSPWLWIVVAVVFVLLALQYLVPNGGYKEIETSKMVANIQSGDVKAITFKDAGNQQILATLDNGDKVMAIWVSGQQKTLVKEVQAQVDKGTIENYKVENPKPNLLGSIIATVLPFILIFGLFLFLMNQVQGDVGERGLGHDQGVPPGTREVPGGRGQDPQGRAALRPARYR